MRPRRHCCDPGYRTVKGILAAGTEHDGQPPPAAVDAPAHLHGPATLFSHLDHDTRRPDTGRPDTGQEVAG